MCMGWNFNGIHRYIKMFNIIVSLVTLRFIATCLAVDTIMNFVVYKQKRGRDYLQKNKHFQCYDTPLHKSVAWKPS